MTYQKTVWKNREVERPRTFEKIENPDGTITLVPAEGNIIEPGTPITADNMNKIEQGIEDAHGDLDEHKADYVHHAGYGSASGTNAKTITLNPVPKEYKEGMTIAFKNITQNTGAVTLNVNGLGAKPVKKPNGKDLVAGNLKANSVYTVRYNGTNFILQGSDSSGTANPEDVLSGKTFSNDNDIDLIGTMPNHGIKEFTPTKSMQIGDAGHYDGVVIHAIPNNLANSIKSIQRGFTTLQGVASLDVTISPISVGNSVALLEFYPAGGVFAEDQTSIQIIDSTTIRIERYGNHFNVYVAWQVIEFDSYGVKSLQKGVTEITSSTATVTISKVNLSKSILFTSHKTNSIGSFDATFFTSRLSSSTQITFFGFGSNQTMYWAVVEFY